MRPTVLDLFSGAGGLGLGFEQAGFDIAASVEIDPIHAAVHSFNFPNCHTICADVSAIRGDGLVRRLGRDIDVVIGGAPCQGFSLIGQRALDDPRNQLVHHFLRLVIEIMPSVFVLENVKGLTLGKHRKFLDEIVQVANQSGFEVLLPWQVLNAKDYSVPQDRQRLFLIGVRKGLPMPSYPEPRTNVVCVSDALGDIPNADQFEELTKTDSVRTDEFGEPSEYAAEMRCMNKAAWHAGYKRSWDPGFLTSSMRTNHSDISKERFRETEQGKVEPISRFFKLPADGVANTLRAGTDSARGAFTSPRPIHYQHARCITVREMARLHGFPDWFRLHPTKWHGARQVGNAVPPPLAREIARSILAMTFKQKPRVPRKVLSLGSESLLGFDMTRAARFWGIAVPIGKRDRKSGAKKRKQTEIERGARTTG